VHELRLGSAGARSPKAASPRFDGDHRSGDADAGSLEPPQLPACDDDRGLAVSFRLVLDEPLPSSSMTLHVELLIVPLLLPHRVRRWRALEFVQDFRCSDQFASELEARLLSRSSRR